MTNQFQDIFLDLVELLFPSTIWNFGYFNQLWNRFANFAGIVVGLIAVGAVYLAGFNEDTTKKRGMFRVFAVVALINAIEGSYSLIMNLVNSLLLQNVTSQFEANIHGAFNPLSLMLVVLVISECYRNNPIQAFLFGLSAFSINILMFGSGYTGNMAILFLLVRIFVVSIICAICSNMAYTFVSYLVMGLYFVISEAAQSYVEYFITFSGEAGFVKDILTILSYYRAEYIVLSFIVVAFALYEIMIITEGKISFKNLGIGKAVSVILLSVALLAAVYFVMFKTDLADKVNQMGKSSIVYDSFVLANLDCGGIY